MFALFASVLCLVSLSQSAPLSCGDLTRTLEELDPHRVEGKWALVAGTQNDSAVADILKKRDSTAVYLHNSTVTLVNRADDVCKYHSRDISMEGHIIKMKFNIFNSTGTFLRTSCQDCMVMTLATESPDYKTVDFFLFSRRREVEPEVIEEFRAQVQCLNMPSPVIMDPNKELCPEQTASKPTAPTEEKTE